MSLRQTWLIVAFALALDQLSKWIVLELLDLAFNGALVLVPGFLKFVLAWNRGVNFGLLASDSLLARLLLIALPVAIALGLSWWVRKGADPLQRLGVGLLVGGGLSNGLDRLLHGAVVDFLNVSAFGFENPYSFNIADIWVFAGAGLLVLSGLGGQPRRA